MTCIGDIIVLLSFSCIFPGRYCTLSKMSTVSKPSGKKTIERRQNAAKQREWRQRKKLIETGRKTREYITHDHADPNSPVNVLRDMYLAGGWSFEALEKASDEIVNTHVGHSVIARAVKNQNLGKPGRPTVLSEKEEEHLVKVKTVLDF